MASHLRKLILLFLVLFCTFTIATAQDTSGMISGTITDDTGAALPGVTVSIIKGTILRTLYTDLDGKYSASGLEPGFYDVRVELPGFVTVEKTDIDVSAATSPVDVAMRPGGLAELVVVSASKVETSLINAPATMSVVSAETLKASPAQNYGDVLRQVPGINVIQTSARDINITSRQGTSTLATSQLALLDGRSIYLDFFGFIAWDFLPVNFDEIKQIEVIRGPASAVWGANAQTGVVNIISRSPREMQGTSLTLSGGVVNRDVDEAVLPKDKLDSGALWGANISHAQALNDQWSFKVSAGYFTEDPLARPVGIIAKSFIPNTKIPTGGFVYPPFTNTATDQPKLDIRFDQDLSEKSKLTYSGGFGGTGGIIHTGIGPFDIQTGTILGYGKVGYSNGNFKLTFFSNILDGEAPALLTLTLVKGKPQPVTFTFKTQTYDVEVGDSILVADHHILSFGGNFRRNNFDLSLAPLGDNRNEVGGYFQDEIFTDRFRFVVGGRVDKFDVIDHAVFSPRLTFMYKPLQSQSLRVSYNKAFRSPSLVNNFLDVRGIVATVLDLSMFGSPVPKFPILFDAIGNDGLDEESTTAYEVGYTGEFGGKTTIGVSYYVNDTDQNINFTPTAIYSAFAVPGTAPALVGPPPGWQFTGIPPGFVFFNPLTGKGLLFPAQFGYLNLGPVRYQGLELSLDQVVDSHINFNVNYSYQKDPEILDDPNPFPPGELVYAPNNRFNASINMDYPRWLATLSVNYADEAFWTDVLDTRFFGATDSYTMVNASFGVRWFNRKVTTSIKLNNMFNQQVQQHIFGDIVRSTIVGEVRFNF